MTVHHKRAIILVNIIGMLLNTYDPKEKTKKHHEIQGRARRGLRREIKNFKGKALEAIDLGGEIWQKAIDNFTYINVEASGFVLWLSESEAKILDKRYDLSQKILEEWAKASLTKDAREIEKNTKEVYEFVLKEINTRLGIEEVRMSFKERLEKLREAKALEVA